jgi:hypothetical protein
MAKETYVRIVDDLTKEVLEEDQVETFSFSFQGKSYTIDMSRENADEFKKTMAKYTSVATQEVSKLPRATSTGRPDKQRLADIRAWAAEKGLDVSSRGRISKSIQDQYDAEH